MLRKGFRNVKYVCLSSPMMEDDGVKGLIFTNMSFIALLPTSPFIFFMPLSSPWIIEGGEWESHDTKTLTNNNFIALDGYPKHFHQDDYHYS
jgi:hypothetical protein